MVWLYTCDSSMLIQYLTVYWQLVIVNLSVKLILLFLLFCWCVVNCMAIKFVNIYFLYIVCSRCLRFSVNFRFLALLLWAGILRLVGWRTSLLWNVAQHRSLQTSENSYLATLCNNSKDLLPQFKKKKYWN
jgi:hypothetical protein